MCIRGVLMVLPLFVACAGGAHAESNKVPETGIQGRIMVSPIRPGPVKKGSEVPNAAPLSNATFRITSNDQVVTTFTSDTQGRFHLALKPGHYSVVLAENRFPKPCGPFEIDVESGKMIVVDWRCDSGMR